ncbi:MAG: hypothetical protein K9N62_15715 [Verrucomicrobia bacterium]|nr:hypothetical protein [Verrucomicrobiota bacterium]
MEIIDNINRLLGDDLKKALRPGSKLKIAASCFSIYAYEALKSELGKIDSLQFIFTSPTFALVSREFGRGVAFRQSKISGPFPIRAHPWLKLSPIRFFVD